jgi:membrane protease YdiL (CAAX protease family)
VRRPEPLPIAQETGTRRLPFEARFTPVQQRLIVVLEILLCSSLPTQLVITNLLVVAGWPPFLPDGSYSLPFVLTSQLADTLVLIVLMTFFMRVHGESATTLWFGEGRVRREVLVGLMYVPIVFFLVVILLNAIRLFLPWLHNVPNNPLEKMAGTTASDAATFAMVAIIAGGVREELQRAFLLHRFEQYLGGATVGVIVTSVAFGLGHTPQGWDAAITTGTMGFLWALLYLDRRSSVAPMVSHAGFNSLEILRSALFGQ